MRDLTHEGPVTGMARIEVEAALQAAKRGNKALCDLYELDAETNTFRREISAEIRAVLDGFHATISHLENALER